MTSIIKVNNLQNQCGANIINESANTITIGASGDTVVLAAGASQSGFGRSGSVNWDTTPKTTSPVTAVSGNGYFINTTSGAITVNLPATPAAGDIVAIADYANTSATNNITVGRNGSKIDGENKDAVIYVNGQVYTLVYVDSTEGWKTVGQTYNQIELPAFIVATGGTVTTSGCGNFKIHTFTGPGTFTVCSVGNAAGSNSVSYVVVAGGGSGGGEINNGYGSGGGGAGGYREGKVSSDPYSASPLATTGLPVSATSYPITVGGGGAAKVAPISSAGASGSNSVFSTITSAGGGGGGAGPNCGINAGAGGSGGGSYGSGGAPKVGAGNTPPTSPPQGNTGGNGVNNPNYAGGGGGGATSVGGNGVGTSIPAQIGGAGGTGATTSISGSPTTYAGGGGGGVYYSSPSNTGPGGAGGSGGGGKGGSNPSPPANLAASGTTNTGGGGGGAGSGFNPCFSNNSGAGGSGIVIIRYKYQ